MPEKPITPTCLDHYALGELLSSSSRSEVYSGVRLWDGLPVVLKLDACAGDPRDQARVCREFQLLSKVWRSAETPPGNGKGCRPVYTASIVRAVELVESGGRPILILERFFGVPLRLHSERRPLSQAVFLQLAVQLAEALSRVHAARIVHKDLNPSNVLILPETGKVQLIGFGQAAEMGEAKNHTQSLEGDMLYMAPEQTGRMNRGIDVRSDLYSLGVTFYELLTGRPPFVSDDASELIQAHIVSPPVPPSELSPHVAPVLSSLVLKLLEKQPEERYQNAPSLLADLMELQRQLSSDGLLPGDFSLGQRQIPSRPLFSSKLYGREREIQTLRSAYRRVRSWASELLLIKGSPGMGKTALVAELNEPLARSGGYLAGSKFDHYRRDLPYAGFKSAFESLAEQILTESPGRLALWKRELRQALGNIAQVMVDLIPELKPVLRDVPAIPKLGPKETEQRLALAVERFVCACATREHPLVLFLDDLQWADAGSRYLMKRLLCSAQAEALLLIGAYRDNEVDSAHPLSELLTQLNENRVVVESISLESLSLRASTQMLADVLGRDLKEILGLADRVASKTGNSPLLIRQFIQRMHEMGQLHYEPGSGWVWSETRLRTADIPDDSSALMTAKMEQLDESARDTLKFASCIGDEFDLQLLVELADREQRPRMAAALHRLTDEGLIAPCRNGLRFVHDRIREAALSLWSPEERSEVHYNIGRLLFEKAPPELLDERVFEIVDHLNRARDRIPPQERVFAMKLNLLAAERALGKGAADTAEGYLAVGRALCQEDDWVEERSTAFTLHFQSAASALHSRRFEDAHRFLDGIQERPLATLEAARVTALRVSVYSLVQELEKAVQVGLAALQNLALPPLQRSRQVAWLALLSAEWLLRRRSKDDLFRVGTPAESGRLPRARRLLLKLASRRYGGRDLGEEVAPATVLISSAVGPAAVRIDPNLSATMTFKGVRNLILLGYPDRYPGAPAFALASYAQHRPLFLKNYRAAYAYGKLALHWAEKLSDPVLKPKTELMVQANVAPWVMPRRRAMAPLARIREAAMEVGDSEFGYYAGYLKALYEALCGESVSAVEAQFRELAEIDRGGSFPFPSKALHRASRLLLIPVDTKGLLETSLEECQRFLLRAPRQSSFVHTYWLLVLCVHKRYEWAFEVSERREQALTGIDPDPFPHTADLCFFHGLAAAASAASERGGGLRRRRRRTAAIGRPGTAAIGLPGTAAIGRPGRAAIGRPRTAAIGLPRTAAIGLPRTAAIGLPGTAAIGRPGTAAIGLPETAAIGLPETAAIGLPGTAAIGRPGTAAIRLPGTAAIRRRLNRCLASLRHWARYGPDFVHMARILEAERARLSGKQGRALALYEQAAAEAAQVGYRHHAALVYERWSDLALELGRREEGARLIKAALAAYEEWGARCKVAELRNDYSGWLTEPAHSDAAPTADNGAASPAGAAPGG